jgi:hypothetical protein
MARVQTRVAARSRPNHRSFGWTRAKALVGTSNPNPHWKTLILLVGWAEALSLTSRTCTDASHRSPLVFRFRSSHQFAAHSRANFGIKGTLAMLMFSSAALDLKFLQEPAANFVGTSNPPH